MEDALLIGSVLGAIVGVLHAWHLYRAQVAGFPGALARRPVATRARAAYHGLWAFALWVIFGSYVLYLWLIAVVAYAIARALAGAGVGRRTPGMSP